MRFHEICSKCLVEQSIAQAKQEIDDALNHENGVSEEEREELLKDFGVLDDLEVDEEGNLAIWRAMNVTMDWIKNAKPGQRLGIYWSHDPVTAAPYDSSFDEHTLVVKAILPAEYVNWDSIKMFAHRGENEVRLGDDERVPLKVVGIMIDGKHVDLPNWTNQVYTD